MHPPRRLPLAAACAAALALAVPAGATLQDQKKHIDASIAALQNRIATSKERSGVLSSEIAAASTQIDSLQGRIAELSDVVAALEAELAEHRARLASLKDKLAEQTRRLNFLVEQHRIAQHRLEERLVQLYEADSPSTVEIFLQAGSLRELIDQLDYFRAIGRQDKQIADELERLRDEMRLARAETKKTTEQVAAATAALAETTAQQRAARDQLVAEEQALAAVRAQKRSLLADVNTQRHEDEEDLDSMQAASARIADQIRAAQEAAAAEAAAAAAAAQEQSGSSGSMTTSSTSGVSSSGFTWPVSGPVISGFGTRWGRLHAGIDIAVPQGTPVHAAASGRIIYAGVMSGYGNIVVIDHGNGLATAYGHLSSIWIGGGSVQQGQSIAASGCTGQCLGPHVHFEVRVNGSPVDPLGYL